MGAESVLSHTEWSGPNQRGTLAWMEHFHQGETGLLRRAPVVLSLSPHARARRQHRSPYPPSSLSIFYSSPLHTHTPVPLASRPPRHSIAGAISPRVLSPPFILCLAGVADRLSGRSQPVAARGFRDRAARCTRPACPLIGRAAVSMVISRKARPPPLSSLPPP